MQRWDPVDDVRVPRSKRGSSCIPHPIYGTTCLLMRWAGSEDVGWTPGRTNGVAMPG
jgi:hypothetical protein